ncbi:hypothetical protein GQ53DRAFT_429575 [Thozetella sp. PMI_491]|nr:hypothetical protein GQ53DRAFT_429575 [Thozetella sp. PMI_491]
MEERMLTSFAHTFLVDDGYNGSQLKFEGPPPLRKKKPHKKSRLGCVSCKKRKVKCDEKTPCGNCIKRHEICRPASEIAPHRPPASARSLPKPLVAVPLSDADGQVNFFHLQLFYHFEQETARTIPFGPVWPKLLQTAFHEKYLLNAMLALASQHLAFLQPEDPRFANAFMGFLQRSLVEYRDTLSATITERNCDALFGTSLLIHFLSWSNIDFLDSQGPDDPLDLSDDRPFVLSRGIRDVHSAAWPLVNRPGGIWSSAPILRPCNALEEVAEIHGLRWRGIRRILMAAYDNPRYRGGRWDTTSPYSPGSASSSSPGEMALETQSPPTSRANVSRPRASPVRFEHTVAQFMSFRFDILRINDIAKTTPFWLVPTTLEGADEQEITRAAFERTATRVSIMVAYVEEGRPLQSYPRTMWRPNHNGMLDYRDVIATLNSLSIATFGPLVPLILNSDSRALLLLYHLYRATNFLLEGSAAWWVLKRTSVMEARLQNELAARGIGTSLQTLDHLI